MLIPLDYLVKKYNIQFKGILHVGAHECEEIFEYDKHLPRTNVLWVEALEDKVELSKSKFENIRIEQAVVSNTYETVTFHRSNNGQSSSIFELGLHMKFHPHVWYTDSFSCETKLLKDILCNYTDIPFNFINLDIQGAELKALKGMEEYLPQIDYIYTEVNSDYVYADCALVGELDEFLQKFGFKRVETEWYGNCQWGDAFYIRV